MWAIPLISIPATDLLSTSCSIGRRARRPAVVDRRLFDGALERDRDVAVDHRWAAVTEAVAKTLAHRPGRSVRLRCESDHHDTFGLGCEGQAATSIAADEGEVRADNPRIKGDRHDRFVADRYKGVAVDSPHRGLEGSGR